jgi:GNAT superfamily N-acetyltransferase
LDVRPEFQRRGFGKALIKWGFGEAEKENVCVSVISGDGKEEFYRSCGIETKDGWSGMGKNNPLAIAPGGLMFWKDVREENVELDVL